MVKVFVGTECEYYLDGYHKNALDVAKTQIKNDWDFLFAYDGMEGSGKSVKAMQDAFYCDPTLTLSSYAFTPDQFCKCIEKAERFSAVVYDEAHSGLNSRATMSLINRSLVSMLTEIRQKNLFVFVVLPTFFDLDKYVALWRARALIHIYSKESFERGYFAFYNVDRKKELYLKGKKLYQYNAARPNFVGRFTNHYPLKQDVYRKLKFDATILRKQHKLDDEVKEAAELLFLDRVMQAENMTHAQKIEVLKMPESTYYLKLKQFRADGAAL
jgi:hypothetical protein